MRIIEILTEAKKVYDLRHPESTLKHWGSHKYHFIDPKDGFFFSYPVTTSFNDKKGTLILYSEDNLMYSMAVKLGGPDIGKKDISKELFKLKKEHNIPEVWNDLYGYVEFNNKTITFGKESYDGNKYRNRSLHYINNLKKLFKDLLSYGITTDYIVKGTPVPNHLPKTVGDIFKIKDTEKEIINLQPVIMYHGTCAKRWEVIQKQGLRPGNTEGTYIDIVPNYSEHNIYLASTPNGALFYAKRQAKKENDSIWIVLKVQVNDPAKILADDRFIPVPQYKYPNGYSSDPIITPPSQHQIMNRARNIKYSESGEYAYRGIILPKFISVFKTGKI